ncbi:MAG: YCF48-related protein, partial [Chloroflexi bacterium]|nr:YCF48-related protein [Chloroflexota bacterium]
MAFTGVNDFYSGRGGGLHLDGGTLTLQSVTVAGNFGGSGAGIQVTSGSLAIMNSAVGNNVSKKFNPALPTQDCNGTLVSQGNNVSGDSTCGFSNAGQGDAQGANLRLGPLADNGGGFLTHVPLYGSPVLERVPVNQCKDLTATALMVDQRGRVRPYTAAGKCDSGAVESGPFLVITNINPPNPIRGKPFDVTVQTQEPDGSPHNVTGDSPFTISRAAGTGALLGIAGGVIPAGGNTTVIPNLIYDTAEAGVMLKIARSAEADGNLEASQTAAFTVPAAPPTRLVITKIDPVAPFAGTAFKVTVQAQDDNWFPTNVLSATDLVLSVKTGAGTLGGVTTGQIPAGQNAVIIQGVTYSQVESGVVLTVSRGAGGDVLAPYDSVATSFVTAAPADSWGAQTSGVSTWLRSVAAFPDGLTAWAGGDSAVLLKTSDGGVTWTSKNNGISGDVYAITALNGTTVFAVTANGNVYRTTDGGDSWQLKYTNPAKGFMGVAAFGSSVWAVGISGFIVYSGDGGANWTAQTNPATNHLYNIAALSATRAVAVGADSNIVLTENSGATWTKGPTVGSASNFLSGVTAAGGTIWVAGNGIYRSDDAGVTWTLQPGTNTRSFQKVAAGGPSMLWASSFSGLIYKTSDGGIGNWGVQNSGTTEHLIGLAAVDTANAWAVGSAGTILRTPTTATTLAITALNPASPVVGQPFTVTVQARGASGNAAPVQADTTVLLSLTAGAGTGTLGGTVTGVIPAGQSTVTIQYMNYDTVETGVKLTAERTDGDTLANGDSAAFAVLPPSQLAVTAIEPASPTQSQTFRVTVQAQDIAGTPINVTVATDVTLSRKTGNGALAGTLTRTIAAGESAVTFDDLTYSVAESGVVLTATRGANGDALRSGASAAFAVLRRLAGYWPGENSANDTGGGGRHGTPANITYADGMVGQAFVLNISSISVANAADLNPPAG